MERKRRWVALMLFTLALMNYVDRVALSFAAGPISKEYGLNSVSLGYLFSSFLWTYTIFLIPAGILVDRFGAKAVAGIGLAIWSAATAMTGLASSFVQLLATRLVMGGGEATSNPSGARVIREWFPANERGAVNAIFNSGSYAGPALCAVVAGPLIEAFGWRVLFFLAGGIGLLWLLCWKIWFARPEDAHWVSDGERATILAERSWHGRQQSKGEASGLLRLLTSGPTLWGLALTQGCNVYSQYLFLTWLPTYLQATKGLTIAKTGFYAALPYAIAVVLCITIGRLSDRALRGEVARGGRRYVIAAAMVLASVILFAPLVDNLWAILALIALSLTGISATTSLNFALVNDLLPNPRDVGVAMAFNVVGGNVFGLMAPIVTGYVIEETGSYDNAFVIAGVLLLVGAASTLTLTRRPIGAADRPARSEARPA
ncbi:MFS transporter [Aliidongia dinghuensis]|uniref:MFS transporter n=1 Tax=Aliidongia dinghuensis TaxID=1867774 RepID=A0A8J3E1B7_9PROT|nr:MFS transporter [Aliidongia dinghuensis]GGF00449.1 MFS transporter [Aliidongia dinghuensis]